MLKKLTTLAVAGTLSALLCMLTACDSATTGQSTAPDGTGTQDAAPDATVRSDQPVAAPADAPVDAVARVGDQYITFNELNTMLNSSAMVGLSIPALGTPERNQVIITLLDKVISANLLYLDALAQGTDKQEPYLSDVANFENAVLAAMYEEGVLIGDITVSEQEIRDFYETGIDKSAELNDDTRMAIEASLRNRKLDERKATMRERLREGVTITIDDGVLDAGKDAGRSDTDVVATAGTGTLVWGAVKNMMLGADQRAGSAPFFIDNAEERMQRLQRQIDFMLLVERARAAGLDRSEEFGARTAEYRKTQLINIHRGGLIQGWIPSDDELREYFQSHREDIVAPESRKVQTVVLESREQADAIRAKLDKGEITMFQAARDYSTDPNAKRTLGELGWVSQGTGFKELDELTFSLMPGEIGGPVQTPAGWQLVKVLDALDGRYNDIDDEETRQRTLRSYLKQKIDRYVIELRKDRFDVAVFEDELTRQFQQEADYIAQLQQQAGEQDSVTQQRLEELQQWITPPRQ